MGFLSKDWMLASKWMHKKTEISDNISVRKAIEIMVELGIGSVIVSSNDGEPGMLTERDILIKVIMKDLDTRKTLVKDIASKPLVTIDENQTLWSAAEIMSKNHIRRLPVKSKKEEIIGVLSTRAISDALPVISRFKEMQEILSNLRKMKHQD